MKLRIPGDWKEDRYKLYWYNDKGHVRQWTGTVRTSLFAEKGFPAYQVIGDSFYLVDQSCNPAVITYGNPMDFIVFRNEGVIEVVKKADFRFSKYPITVRRIPFENTLDYLSMKDRSERPPVEPIPEPKRYLRGYRPGTDLESDDTLSNE